MKSNFKKICVVTGSRSDYGLLRCVLKELNYSNHCELQLIVTGMHLSSRFGNTWKIIENDGFNIDWKIQMPLESDTALAITKSMGLALSSFADAFDNLRPDLLILLGDRFELLPAANAAIISGVPIAHLHGGELTERAYDDMIRHAISKMSYYHFTASEEYRNRVIQMGEAPNRVWNVGGFGIDEIVNTKRLKKSMIEKKLGIKFKQRNLLVTFHPETLSDINPKDQMIELLSALENPNYNLIFTMPNADNDGKVLFKMIKDFVKLHPERSCAHVSLGSQLYISTLFEIDGIVGNSSSGIIEGPAVKKGTVNIGDRQKGRLKASSIINCNATRNDISRAIETLFTPEFELNLSNTISLYGEGGASKKTVKLIEKLNLKKISKKFIDFPISY